MSTDPTVSATVDLDDEPYDSAEDEDFQLEGAHEESDLSSDDDAAEPAKKKRKTTKNTDTPEDELDSGDEVTIRKAREKRETRRKGKKPKGKNAGDDDIDLDDDEGGTGGFVRTRAMKMQIQEERKPLAKIDGATIDVDALWKKMNTPGSELGLRPNQIKRDSEPATEHDHTGDTNMKDQIALEPENKPGNAHTPQMIKIKRTYKFAGEMITEEKTVPKDSAEAKAFLSSGETIENSIEEVTVSNRNLRRPLRKMSRFDPNPTGAIKKSWEKQAAEAGDQAASGPKINTVEKSRLDWAQYVDHAGISDELRVHSKAKEGYMGRMDFLGRTEARKDEEARQARIKRM
ncbi:hypothetical protein N7454_007340 [Penicillium verhagenii]|nr:hypothetical protein N7454_007340 [Penicillium verhagenii]